MSSVSQLATLPFRAGLQAVSALNPLANARALGELFGLLRRHRTLTLELTKREIGERYAGQVLGSAWAIGHPLALMLIYVLVFTFIFKMNVQSIPGAQLGYAVHMLSGLIPWMAFQESMTRGATAVTGQANLVKQVVFPVEVLPIKGVLVALVTQMISVVLLMVYVALAEQTVYWTYLLLPYLFVVQAMAMAGVAMIAASVGVYFRDLKDFIQVVSTALLFLMPVFYSEKTIDQPAVQTILAFNPFCHLVWCYRDALYYGSITYPVSWVVLTVLALLVFCVGHRTFRQLKTMFGNVL